MDTTFETLEAEVLKLPSAQRAKLLDRVVASLGLGCGDGPARGGVR